MKTFQETKDGKRCEDYIYTPKKVKLFTQKIEITK